MSSQKGNTKKQGPPKHQNVSAFRNSMHDTSKKTKMITSLEVSGVCSRCVQVIEWKIKYKKYKPLTQPKKCVKCQQKRVKRAYYIVCQVCADEQGICAKCGEKAQIVKQTSLSPEEEARKQCELEFELSQLSERKRRTFHRYQESLNGRTKSKKTDGSDKDDELSEGSVESDLDQTTTLQEDSTMNTSDEACGHIADKST